MTIARRPQEASNLAEVTQYFKTRARQLWHEGWRWNEKIEDLTVGVRTEFTSSTGEVFASYYIFAPYHGQGHYRKLVEQEKHPIVTITDCHIEQLLEHLGVRYLRAGAVLDSPEYRLIEAVFGDTRDEDSGKFQMDHIDEGLAVLTYLGADILAKRAFCLHPLVQSDASLEKYFDAVSGALDCVDDGARTLALAMEFRQVANAWPIDASMPATSLRKSPLTAVNHMLIADKIQSLAELQGTSKANDDCLLNHHAQWLDLLGASESHPVLQNMLPKF